MAFARLKKQGGFLNRLRRDEAGNVIAIFAAAVFPAIGLIGGGVDMSRIVLTRTSLQAACDAGSLMGRKVMGQGTWEANNNRANERAELMFDSNFADGAYGTERLTRSYSEDGGNVRGSASVAVPMTLMRVFNQKERVVTVDCQSELRIPDTDVMFVLDVTGSMAWCANGSDSCRSNGQARIDGLRTATKCFYEALAKVDISSASPEDCGEAQDPVDLNEGSVRLRFGFVPYNVNVNVGRLLPLDYIADRRTYQSREANFRITPGETINEPVFGDESDFTLIDTDTSGGGGFSNWQTLGFSIRRGSVFFSGFVSGSRNQCGRLTPPTPTTIGGSNDGEFVLISQSPNPVNFPTSQVTRTYERRSGGGTTLQYRYRFRTINFGFFRRSGCWLQRRTQSAGSTVETHTTTQPVTWDTTVTDSSQEFDGWTYKPVEFDISSLKDSGNNTWNQGVSLPIGSSGSNTTVPWEGCIEERQTFQNTDGDASDDWSPIPAAALDLDIDREPDPNNPATQWGPILPTAVWARFDNGSFTRDTFVEGSGNYGTQRFNSNSSNYWVSCPTEASLYKIWQPNEFSNYLDGLDPEGNTYHDIGLLWGARLMSPTGIFSNITNDTNDVVERHMVFMTDGDTNTRTRNYTAYGINWWDQRQTNDNNPSDADIGEIVDARTQAICNHVKSNLNITLWVVAYGESVSASTRTNLENCASAGRFFEAADSAALTQEFKGIAAAISNLRLTE